MILRLPQTHRHHLLPRVSLLPRPRPPLRQQRTRWILWKIRQCLLLPGWFHLLRVKIR